VPWLALLFVSYACGGKASSNLEPTGDDTETDAGAQQTMACECPSNPPWESPECGCPGLSCNYSRHFCWPGEVVCDADGQWDFIYPELSECPADRPMHLRGCDGTGSCSYQVDVGCGPVTLEAMCSCLDASYLFQYYGEPPPLCDCTAIGERDLCERYPRDCIWSDERAACQTGVE
jgi:hypothetical protein